MKALGWFEALAEASAIAGALVAGLAAAYGRELEAGRDPSRRWWIRRLLIMPLLAILAAAAADTFEFRTSLTAMVAAMLSLGGYDLVYIIEARFRRRFQLLAEKTERGHVDAAS